jgi:hypothetical protein
MILLNEAPWAGSACRIMINHVYMCISTHSLNCMYVLHVAAPRMTGMWHQSGSLPRECLAFLLS